MEEIGLIIKWIAEFELHGGDRTWDEGVCIYEFEKKIRIIKSNNMYGLVDDDEILPPIYSSISIIKKTESIVWFKVAQKDKYGIIQCGLKESKFILDIEYDSIEEVNFEDDYRNNYLLIVTITQNDLYGIYKIASNSSLQWYDKVQFIGERNRPRFFFLVEKNGLKGACNKYGDLSIPCIYDEIKFDGYYFLYLEKKEQVETYSFENKEFITLKYDKVVVTRHGAKVYSGDHVGVFREGKEICPPIYDDVRNDIIIKVSKLLGVITASGSIIEPKFDNLTYLTSGYYVFLHNNKWGVVSTNCIIPPKYDYIYDGRYSHNIYGRIGREMYNISKKEKFIGTFLLDKSYGYENSDSPIFKFDSSDIDLLAI